MNNIGLRTSILLLSLITALLFVSGALADVQISNREIKVRFQDTRNTPPPVTAPPVMAAEEPAAEPAAPTPVPFVFQTPRSAVTVHFDMQGGSSAFADLELDPDEYGAVYFNLPDETPVRTGYRFIGWYCEGLEMEYGLCNPGDSIAFAMDSGTLTYVAQWENNNHQESCPYLMAFTCDYPEQADIVQVDFKCIQEAPTTYYAVHNWYNGGIAEGYAGFQILEDGRHVVIMSVWDSDAMRPTIEYAPYSRKAQDFGGEGTGKQVISEYDWTKLRWYTMRIQARTFGDKTVFEQWIRPEGGDWEKICAISFPVPGCGFNYNGAFLEDFYPFSNLRRSMQLANASAHLDASGVWQANRRYSISNYEDQRMQQYNVNYNCKAEAAGGNALYMQTGGSGYEMAIELPKTVELEYGEATDQYLLE